MRDFLARGQLCGGIPANIILYITMSGLTPRHPYAIKVVVLVLLLLSAHVSVSGQHNPYEFFGGGTTDAIGNFQLPQTDIELFYTPEYFSNDIFTDMSEFNFSHVRYSRRGYSNAFDKTYVGNALPFDRFISSPDYSSYYNLKRTRFNRGVLAGGDFSHGFMGLNGETEVVSADLSLLAPSYVVSAFASDRKGRGGGRLGASGNIKDKWFYTANIYGRWGRDASYDGAFTDEVSFLAGLQRNINKNHSVSVIFMGSSMENGSRSYATREAFGLTGNKYYNPSWGYFNGKKRNSKVTERFQPLVVLDYSGRLTASTTLSATLSHRTGESSYSALGWFDAATPYPDYYRYMPSYASGQVAEILTDKWKNGDLTVTQTDWDNMYAVNQMNGERAVYTLEERVEKANDSQIGISFRTQAHNNLDVSYGMRYRRDDTRFFKRMKDLLGGLPVTDTDQYLYEDEVFGGMTSNNIRDPYRIINEGDKFGYDYYITGQKADAFGMLEYVDRRFMVSAGFEMSKTSIRRDGKYEKEIYPGGLSYGRSDKFTCEAYTAKLSAGYTITPRHRISATVMTATLPPLYGNIFLSPNYTNMMIDDPKAYKLNSAQLSYGMTAGIFRLNLSGYYTATSDETAVYNYYDDISHIYSDMVLSGISKKYMGVELGMRVDISPRFTVSVAAAVNNYKYSRDPDVEIYEDATLKSYVSESKTRLDGYRLGGSPERVASIEIKYNAIGWLASLTYNYAGNRYLSPNPLRRMSRAYNLASSPERFDEFVAQEKLPDAGTVNLFIMRTFRVANSRLSLMASVSNLLNGKDIIYNGYEQMRIMKRGNGVNVNHMPFPSKYMYAYGRNYYVSMIWRF